MFIKELWRYPVKSMAGEQLNASEVGKLGVAGDRKVLVVSILMVTAVAWLALWRLEDFGHGSLHHHVQAMDHSMDHAMACFAIALNAWAEKGFG